MKCTAESLVVHEGKLYLAIKHDVPFSNAFKMRFLPITAAKGHSDNVLAQLPPKTREDVTIARGRHYGQFGSSPTPTHCYSLQPGSFHSSGFVGDEISALDNELFLGKVSRQSKLESMRAALAARNIPVRTAR